MVELNLEIAVTWPLECSTFSPTSFSFDLLGDANFIYTAALPVVSVVLFL